MELNLQKRKGGLGDKIPDIQKTLDSVRFLKMKRVRSFMPAEPCRKMIVAAADERD